MPRNVPGARPGDAGDGVVRLSFFVSGLPIAQGSMRWFPVKGPRRVILTSTAQGLQPWREVVGYAAQAAMRRAGRGLYFAITTPVSLDLLFILPRPKRVPVSWNAPRHTKRPDIDKLARACLDALADGQVYANDAQVDRLRVEKRYTVSGDGLYSQPGVEITVTCDLTIK